MAVNREFGLFLNGGSVHLSSTPVSRQHRGHIYLDTPRGAVRTGSWHHVAAVLASDVDGGVMRIYIDGAGAAWFANDRSDPFVGFKLSDSVIWPWAWRPDRSGKEQLDFLWARWTTVRAWSLPALSTTIQRRSSLRRTDGR